MLHHNIQNSFSIVSRSLQTSTVGPWHTRLSLFPRVSILHTRDPQTISGPAQLNPELPIYCSHVTVMCSHLPDSVAKLPGSHDHLHLKDVAFADAARDELLEHLLAVEPVTIMGSTTTVK